MAAGASLLFIERGAHICNSNPHQRGDVGLAVRLLSVLVIGMLEGIIVENRDAEIIIVGIEKVEDIFVPQVISLSSIGQAGNSGHREHLA